MDKLDYLIKYLADESKENIPAIPKDIETKKRLYRALVNIREPKEISDEFLKIEDEYLKEELKRIGVTSVDNIKTIAEVYGESSLSNADKMCIWQGDITKLQIDAVVNAGNSQGLGCFIPNHNCIDNQLNTYAGVRLRLACNDIMKDKAYNLENGEAIITSGFNLPAKYVIQTVGPMIDYEVTDVDIEELTNCYLNSLTLAVENGIRTISIPCISTGLFRFPKKLACGIAIDTVDKFIDSNRDKLDKVVFNLWSDEDVNIYERHIKAN